MPAKAPIYLKPNSGRNVASNTSRSGGKRLRDLLSSEMISLPLGDFRHTAHVGRGTDDVFGDTTFLQKSSPNISQSGDDVNMRNGFGKRNKKSRNRSTNDKDPTSRRPLSNQSCDAYGIMDSPSLQSAISLPLLNQDSNVSIATPHETKQVKNKKKRLLLHTKIGFNKTKSHETGLNCLLVMADHEPPYERATRCSSRESNAKSSGRIITDKDSESRNACSSTSTEPSINSTEIDPVPAEETLNFDFDFGPSLLDEVLCELDKIKL